MVNKTSPTTTADEMNIFNKLTDDEYVCSHYHISRRDIPAITSSGPSPNVPPLPHLPFLVLRDVTAEYRTETVLKLSTVPCCFPPSWPPNRRHTANTWPNSWSDSDQLKTASAAVSFDWWKVIRKYKKGNSRESIFSRLRWYGASIGLSFRVLSSILFLYKLFHWQF